MKKIVYGMFIFVTSSTCLAGNPLINCSNEEIIEAGKLYNDIKARVPMASTREDLLRAEAYLLEVTSCSLNNVAANAKEISVLHTKIADLSKKLYFDSDRSMSGAQLFKDLEDRNTALAHLRSK